MNRTKSIFTGSLLGLGLLLAAGQPAHAVQAVWDNTYTPSDWTRGSTPGSHYGEWNVFSDETPTGNIVDTTPEVSSFGSATYHVEETSGTAFVTSGGNIYSFAGTTFFDFDISNLGGNAGDVHDVSLRVGSLGNFDTTLMRSFTNFMLNGLAGSYQELFNSVAGGPFGGNEVEALVTWNDVPTASLFNLTWNAVGSSVSLDQLSIDVSQGMAAVPLPAAVYLMASGLAGIAALARRRQKSA